MDLVGGSGRPREVKYGRHLHNPGQFLSAHRRPGDAIVYPASLVPPWYLAYPDGFAQLRDLSMAENPAASGRLFGDTVPLPVLERREESVHRIWIVPVPGQNPAAYLAPGFRLTREWNLPGQQVLLYTRTRRRRQGPPGSAGVRPAVVVPGPRGLAQVTAGGQKGALTWGVLVTPPGSSRSSLVTHRTWNQAAKSSKTADHLGVHGMATREPEAWITHR